MFDSRGGPVTEYDSKSSSMDRHLLDLTFLHLSLFLCFFSFFSQTHTIQFPRINSQDDQCTLPYAIVCLNFEENYTVIFYNVLSTQTSVPVSSWLLHTQKMEGYIGNPLTDSLLHSVDLLGQKDQLEESKRKEAAFSLSSRRQRKKFTVLDRKLKASKWI